VVVAVRLFLLVKMVVLAVVIVAMFLLEVLELLIKVLMGEEVQMLVALFIQQGVVVALAQ
jgi:hypothetical protein